ncbi:MAG: ABC transporter permease [Alphaproteobacteria bacterium]|nr:ABC transporter permease [Alphaproteobacteria bacterium]
MWARIAALVHKELLAVWRDRRSRLVLIVPPIIQLALFAYAATYNVDRVRYAIWDEDRGQLAREFAARFEGSQAFHREATVGSAAAARDLLDRQRVAMVLHIGQTFTADIKAARPAPVQVLLDGRRSNTAQAVLGYVNAIADGFNAELAAASGRTQRATLVQRAWFNPVLESQWFILPGLVATLTLIAAVLVTCLSVARERELGTFDQLLVTPLRPFEILLGKALPALLIGLIEASVILAAAVLWFGVPFRGSLGLLYLALVLFIMAVIGIGLMISAVSQTQQQAMLGAMLALVPAVILSGFATPIANMPDVVQWLTYVNPVRYVLVILRGLFLQDLPPHLVLQQLWPLLPIASVTMAAAALMFRRLR